jgi:UDP-N-acetyl-D-galactosamine dehydrogenase
VDIYGYFIKKGAITEIYDPWVDTKEAERIYQLKTLRSLPKKEKYDAIIVAVAHKQFKKLNIKRLKSLLKRNGIIYDVKSIYSKTETNGSL